MTPSMTNKHQLCPKCNGQGTVSKPPCIPGDIHRWESTSLAHVCNVCNGAKIIPIPITEQSLTQREDEFAMGLIEWLSKDGYTYVTDDLIQEYRKTLKK